jgi:hypothetical protein
MGAALAKDNMLIRLLACRRRALTGESETKTDKESSTNEHADGLRGRLYGSSDTHDCGAEEDRPTSTDAIRHVRRKWITS